jgi:hypothetical protein
MHRGALALMALALLSAPAAAQDGVHALDNDISFSGLIPVTWASDSPTLSHLGCDALLGFEYDSPLSIPIRLELGYLGVSASRVSQGGELYRAWEGMRIALLSGYLFKPILVSKTGALAIGVLAGGVLTAADYTDTALAYAYPSLILEPRANLDFHFGRTLSASTGPWLALPCELMFRSGVYTLSSGLSLGWRFRLEVAQ